MNQSERKGNTCDRPEAREKACGKSRLVFDFFLIGRGCNQSQSAVKQNERKREITLDTQMKTALKAS